MRALIDELKDAGHRTLVFSHFTRHLEIVAQALVARGMRGFELDRSTPADVAPIASGAVTTD